MKDARSVSPDETEEIEQLVDLAVSYLDHGNVFMARKITARVLDMAPAHERALLLFGEICFQRGDMEGSEDIVRRCLSLHPNSYDGYFHLAQVMIARFKLDSALKALEASLSINPEYYDAMLCKANLLYWLDDDSYKDWIKKAEDVDPYRTQFFVSEVWITAKIPNVEAIEMFKRLPPEWSPWAENN